jgi:hypothetical protein
MNRRSFLTVLIGAPAVAAVAAACGDDRVQPGNTSAPSGIPHPSGAADTVLRLGFEGGFVPVGTAFVNLPTLLVSGDGRVFRPGAMTLEYPGKLLPPITVQPITEAGIQALLRLADDTGLIAAPPDYTAETNVADVPDTVLVINAKGGSFTHRAYALGFEPETTPARQKFAGFVDVIGDLAAVVGAANLGTEEILVPAELRFQATEVDEATLAGYEMEPTIVDWPADAGVRLAAATTCARSTAASVLAAFADATQLTFFRDAGVVYQVAAVAVLPGDPAC